jgi:hypothetical protein
VESALRILLGSLLAAVALAGAAYLYSGAKLAGTSWRVGDRANDRSLLEVSSAVIPGDTCNPHAARWHEPYGPACTATHHRAGWQTPLALLVAVVGVGSGAAIMLSPR